MRITNESVRIHGPGKIMPERRVAENPPTKHKQPQEYNGFIIGKPFSQPGSTVTSRFGNEKQQNIGRHQSQIGIAPECRPKLSVHNVSKCPLHAACRAVVTAHIVKQAFRRQVGINNAQNKPYPYCRAIENNSSRCRTQTADCEMLFIGCLRFSCLLRR